MSCAGHAQVMRKCYFGALTKMIFQALQPPAHKLIEKALKSDHGPPGEHLVSKAFVHERQNAKLSDPRARVGKLPDGLYYDIKSAFRTSGPGHKSSRCCDHSKTLNAIEHGEG